MLWKSETFSVVQMQSEQTYFFKQRNSIIFSAIFCFKILKLFSHESLTFEDFTNILQTYSELLSSRRLRNIAIDNNSTQQQQRHHLMQKVIQRHKNMKLARRPSQQQQQQQQTLCWLELNQNHFEIFSETWSSHSNKQFSQQIRTFLILQRKH